MKDPLPDSKPQPLPCTRREFVGRASLAAVGWFGGSRCCASPAGESPANPIPRWRGFNLTNFFQALSKGEEGQGEVREDDLRWIRDWGFDYVRLPMDYWMWVDSDWRETRELRAEDACRVDERMLERIDRAVDLCGQYGLHVTLNFHRAPGYCINNPEREPFVLWRDRAAEEAFEYHWDLFAKRYREVPTKRLSFNLVNEAPRPREGYMSRADYARVMTRATERIRRHTPDRLVMVDGLSVGTEVVEELIPLGVAQSVHAYWPGGISHYRASWVDRDGTFPTPSWPLVKPDGTVQADRKMLESRYRPWGELARRGVGVHCGECGCYNKTAYRVFIAWFTDVLEVLRQHAIGYALWNFRGSFGILDSGRTDIEYEDWHGHRLDRGLLELLQRF